MLKQFPAVVRPPPSWTSYRRLLEDRILSELKRSFSDPRQLKVVHARIVRAHLHDDPFITPCLVSSFASARLIHHARAAFDHVPRPNVVLWNTLIRAYVDHDDHLCDALSSFSIMQQAGVSPDNFTFTFLLKSCSGLSNVSSGQMIHAHLVKFGFHLADVFVRNALIDMYGKCDSLDDARQMFDEMPQRDIVSWNAMLAAYAKAGEMDPAGRLFEAMEERDIVSWNTLIDGYVRCGDVESAYKLFVEMPDRNVVSWSSVMSGYCKIGDMEMAQLLFDKMPFKTLVSWTIIIAGYAEKGDAIRSLQLYEDMQRSKIKLDEVAAATILSACARSGLLCVGKRVHSYIKRTRFKFGSKVHNSLLDMYAKCGNLIEAIQLFERLPQRSVVSWNCMIQGLAVHGLGRQALDLFTRMQTEGVTPDAITFLGVLSACGHIGLVDEAYGYFLSMQKDFGINPKIEHYGCMVDVLGRAGLVEEAFEFIRSMPIKPNNIVWSTLLAACRACNSVEIAEKVVAHLMELEPTNVGNYALLSNIYAATGNWDDVAKTRVKMKSTKVQKEHGVSAIEVNDTAFEFTAGDKTHPDSTTIYQTLDRLRDHLKDTGYATKLQFDGVAQ